MEQESRTDREMVGNGNAAPLPGDGALCESLAQLSVSGEDAIDDEDLLSRIRLFECPDKAVVAARAIKMGLRMSRAVEQAIGASCKFERKGSLFDDKLCVMCQMWTCSCTVRIERRPLCCAPRWPPSRTWCHLR